MKLQAELDKIDIPEEINQLTALQKLHLFWGIISVILRFVKFFTGAKADEKIDLILHWGESELPTMLDSGNVN